MERDLPPELALLEAQLVQLFEQVDAGQLTPSQAQPALDALVAFDADGNRWTVSPRTRPPDTTFLLAVPGAAPRRADPAAFRRPGPAGARRDDDAPATRDPAGWDGDGAPFGLDRRPEPARGPHTDPVPGPGRATGRRRVAPDAGPAATAARLGAALRRPRVRAVVAAVAVASAVAVYLVASRDAAPDAGPLPPAAATCPAADPPVAGLPADLAPLADCLDATGTPSMLDTALALDGDQLVFAPGEAVSRPWVIYAAAVLYRSAGGPDVAPTAAGDLSEIPPELQRGVQLAVDAGLVDPAAVAGGQVSRADAAVLLDTVYQRLGRPAPPAAPAAADAAGNPAADVQSRLAGRGVSDTAAGAAFGFGAPLDSQAYVTMFGRALRDLAAPSLAAPAGTGPAPADDEVRAALEELQSGDRSRAAAVVAVPGDDATRALQTAYFAGFPASGLVLESTAASPAGDRATSQLTVTGPDGTRLASGTATWVREASTWKLDQWPGMSRIS